MLSKRLIVSIPLLLSLLPSYGLSEPSNPTADERGAAADVEVLQQLLDQVDPPSLHSLLHEYSPKEFKHGMFMEDRIAVEAIHRDDPPLAASIVSLAKRASNTTVSTPAAPSVPAASTSLVNPGPSSSPPDQTSATPPTSVETSPDEGSATPTPTSDASSPTVASPGVQQPTTTNESAASATSSDNGESTSRSAGSVFTITNSYGVVIVTTAGGGASTIATASVSPSATTTGSTTLTTASAKTSKSSSTIITVQTSTQSNGSRIQITSTMVVEGSDAATPTGSAGATGGTGTGIATPGLQNGVAVRPGSVVKEMLCLVLGAVGVAMLM